MMRECSLSVDLKKVGNSKEEINEQKFITQCQVKFFDAMSTKI